MHPHPKGFLDWQFIQQRDLHDTHFIEQVFRQQVLLHFSHSETSFWQFSKQNLLLQLLQFFAQFLLQVKVSQIEH